MPLHSAQIIDELRSSIAEYNALAVNLPPKAISLRPSAEAWSPAEIIDHLRATTDTYRPKFDALLAGTYKAPWHASVNMVVTMFGNLILKAVRPGSKPMKTFGVFEPRHGNLGAEVLDDFRASQEWLIAIAPRLERAGLFNAVVASAASKLVVYRVSTAFEILIEHQRRHLVQMERTCARLANQ